METKGFQAKYREAVFKKIILFLRKVEKSDAVSKAELYKGKIHITFKEPVEIEDQDIMNLFIRGGAIKKKERKDNIKDQFFEIAPIGEP
jgi:hypothetical protein